MKTYNVCNDLSLSLTDEQVKNGYKWIRKDMFVKDQVISVELGYCIKHKELHYLRTNSDVNLEGEGL
jgi:hypothetical protein